MAKLYDSTGKEIELEASGGGEVPRASIAAFRRIGVVGDSFASGTVNVEGGQPSYTALSWPQVMGRLAGAEVVNYTKAGLSTRTWLTDANGLTKLLADDPQGLYILALGINDDNLGSNYIGTAADVDTGADTFYGNYGKIISQIMAHAPGSKLVMTTLARQEPLKLMLDNAIQALAVQFGLPCIVLEEDDFFTGGSFPMSSGHPSVVDYSGMAEAMARLVGQCMAANPAYFKDYADEGNDGSTADLSGLFQQAPTGGFGFGFGGTIAYPLMVKKNGFTCLQQTFTFRVTRTPGVASAYGYTNWFPDVGTGSDGLSTSASDFCVVGDELWCFGTAPDDNSAYGVCWRVKYDPRTNEMLEAPRFFWHNWGHINSINYNPVTDCLIMGNGSADYSLANKLYIINNVSQIKKLAPGAVISLAEWGTVVDLSGYDFGAKVNAVWNNVLSTDVAYNTQVERWPNRVYIYADDLNRIYDVVLGYDADGKVNQYAQYGTYAAPANGRGWNGTYNVLAAYQAGDPDETIGNPGSYSHCGQGADTGDGTLHTGVGHTEYHTREIRPCGAGKLEQRDTWLLGYNKETGAAQSWKITGIAVTNRYKIVGINGNIYFNPW